ncbi:hypothetical protein [Rubritalea sp.]|uniref:hypothetical protein n=1 Tax=Rubritalea sp. TaxID=2109375 RepID=UPI003EF21A35
MIKTETNPLHRRTVWKTVPAEPNPRPLPIREIREIRGKTSTVLAFSEPFASFAVESSISHPIREIRAIRGKTSIVLALFEPFASFAVENSI